MRLEPLDDAGGVRVLRASGEVDVVVVPDLLPRLGGLVAGAEGVVLDLTEVSFFDSSGVRLVDRLARECRRAGARLRVVAPPGSRALRVLEIVGMAEPLVAADLPTAIDEARAGS